MAVKIRAFKRPDSDAVVTLWREAGLARPWNEVMAFYDRQGYEQFDVGMTGKRLIPDGDRQ